MRRCNGGSRAATFRARSEEATSRELRAGRSTSSRSTWRSPELARSTGEQAGSALLDTLRGLDKKGEPYVVVGYSHGRSVIASALIESVSRRKPLVNLKRWITIGTPFVGMRKERFLFSRLTLTRRVVFVASLMLFLMFLFYVLGELYTHGFQARNERYYTALLFSAVMMTLPILFSYIVFRYLDGRELKGYSGGTVQRAREYYSGKWLPGRATRTPRPCKGCACCPT